LTVGDQADTMGFRSEQNTGAKRTFRSGRVLPMKLPLNCGDAYDLLAKHFGTEDLGELTRLTKISRSTLAYWRSCPSARMRKNGRLHLQRIFSGKAAGEAMKRSARDPGVATLLDMFQEVRDILSRIEQKLMDRYS
jgi:hypothetical protein